ncbi:hypothetical protein EYF80_035589 [Liparis tanakae]|uniref:Uncharacterized protein n=1 Tax=Liparis tanakae TaxID=230148 RepID=A0A4Z2GL21_9TELE|nr:hypothetical protein EYF80_035589 [Liparis tanakae]
MAAPCVSLEALSALTGCAVRPTAGPSQLSPQDLVNVVVLKEFYRQQGFKQLDYPGLGSLSLQDLDSQDLYGSPGALTEGPSTAGPEDGSRATIRINPEDFFHPDYDYDFTSIKVRGSGDFTNIKVRGSRDFTNIKVRGSRDFTNIKVRGSRDFTNIKVRESRDFTNIKDGDRVFLRGGERYGRPCGWRRLGLRVTERYEGGAAWLGEGAESWPVSYHGHNMDGSLGVILTRGEGAGGEEPGFLDAAAASLLSGGTRGRGVYSTADLATAERHCRTFRSQVDGKTYKVVLQNRINPEKRRRCQRDGVWLVYVPTENQDLQTRALVQEAIRPYGLLLKEA